MWTKELNALNSKISHDDFCKSKYLGLLLYKNDIAGLHLYKFHNFSYNYSFESECISQNYPKEFLSLLVEHNVKTAITFEYLTVFPKYRLKGRLSLGKILLGLSTEFLMSLSWMDAAIGVTRDSRKVHEMARDFGSRVYNYGFWKNNEPSSHTILLKHEFKKSSDLEVSRAVDFLWANRHQQHMDLSLDLPLAKSNAA